MSSLLSDQENLPLKNYLKEHFSVFLQKDESFTLTFNQTQKPTQAYELTIDLLHHNQSYQISATGLIPISDVEHKEEALEYLMNALISYFEEFFQNKREVNLPLEYKEYFLFQKHIWLKGFIQKPHLNQAADEWLKTGFQDLSLE